MSSPYLPEKKSVSTVGHYGNCIPSPLSPVFSVWMLRHRSPSCSPADSSVGPESSSVHLAVQALLFAKAQMPLAEDLGGLLSVGSPNQMCLGCRTQAAGQEGPEMPQILFLH